MEFSFEDQGVSSLLGMLTAMVLLALTLWWSSVSGSKPFVKFKKGSKFCERVVEACAALKNIYHPTLLWGKSAHVQTMLFGSVGRFDVRPIHGKRYSVVLQDGSTLHYDVFEPRTPQPGADETRPELDQLTYTMFVCPGIGNSTDCKYVRAFSAHATAYGFRVVVFNHIGALKTEVVTGRRIFSYGGTGDITAVFDELCLRYPHTKFIGCGFSMGACILLRFLGEDPKRQSKFVCAASVCQGYDPTMVCDYMFDWKNLRRFYNFGIARKQIALIRRHSVALFPSANQPASDATITKSDHAMADEHRCKKSCHSKTGDMDVAQTAQSWADIEYSNEGFVTSKRKSVAVKTSESNGEHKVTFTCNGGSQREPQYMRHSQSCSRLHTYGDFDSNGFCIDSEKIQSPEESKLWRITNLYDLDECYTRRVLGFESAIDMYRWTSCVDLMFNIKDLPMLIVNSKDDPLVDMVDSNILNVPLKYIEHNPNALFVMPSHGGHLGFFEGGVIIPNSVSWIDRLLVQFSQACISCKPS